MVGSTLAKEVAHTSWGRYMDQSDVKKETIDNWPGINKDLDGLSYVSDLYHLRIVFFLIQDTHSTLWVCLSA